MNRPEKETLRILFHRFYAPATMPAFRSDKHPRNVVAYRPDTASAGHPDIDQIAENAGVGEIDPDARRRVYYCALDTSILTGGNTLLVFFNAFNYSTVFTTVFASEEADFKVPNQLPFFFF